MRNVELQMDIQRMGTIVPPPQNFAFKNTFYESKIQLKK